MKQVHEFEGFPGRVFNGEGESIDRIRGGLSLSRLERCSYRAVVTLAEPLDVGLIWVLRSSARFDVLSPDTIGAATWRMLHCKQGTLILGQTRAPIEFQDGLIRALLAAEDAEVNAACFRLGAL